MDLDKSIHSEADLAALIDAYRRVEHAGAEASEKIVEQYSGLRQPVAVTRELMANNPRLGLELEHLAVEGLAESGFKVLANNKPPDVPASAGGLWSQSAVDPGGHVEPVAKPVDFGRVVNSTDDIRHLVAAYRLALYGDEAAARKVYQVYPELQEVVKRTQAYGEGAESLARWEEVGVEALVERGLRTLEEKASTLTLEPNSLPSPRARVWGVTPGCSRSSCRFLRPVRRRQSARPRTARAGQSPNPLRITPLPCCAPG
jgi:hypothetical protein